MKKSTILAVISALLMFISGCSKDKEQDKQHYTKCDLVSIKVIYYPVTKPSGNSWDNAFIPDNPLPDIYLTISTTVGNQLLSVTSEKPDLSIDELPITTTYITPFKIPDFNGQYTLMLWDDDANISSTGSHDKDDQMSIVKNLSPSNMVALGYPETSEVVSDDGKFKAVLTLRWYN